MKIPKKIHIIWIGNRPAPMKWINTWKEHNPGWEFKLWGNKEVFGGKWKNQKMINHYLEKTKEEDFTLYNGKKIRKAGADYFKWHIIADIVRYEILFEEGGYMPGADTECVRPIDDKFGEEEIYTVNTGHLYTEQYKKIIPNGDRKLLLKKKRFQPENCSPILASVPKHPFLRKCIKELPKRKWGEAVDTTGNVFMGDMLKKYGKPDNMRILKYIRKHERVNPYSKHFAGTTTNSYHKGV